MFWKRKKETPPTEPKKETKTEQTEPTPTITISEKAKAFAEMFKDTYVREIALEKYELMSQKEAFFEPFAWLLKYLDDNPCPSVVQTGSDTEYQELSQKGISPFLATSLPEHTKNVLEQGYIILKKTDPNFYLYEGQWILTALGHDIGKALLSRNKEGKEKNQQHQEVSRNIMVNLLMYSSYARLPFGVANSIIDAVARHHEGKEAGEGNLLLYVLIRADQKARELERINYQNRKEELSEDLARVLAMIQEGQVSFFYDKKSGLYRVKLEELEGLVRLENLERIDGVKLDEKFLIISKDRIKRNVLRTG